MTKPIILKPSLETESGIIILTTIGIISIVSLLVLSFMQDIFLFSKLNARYITQQNTFYVEESALINISLNFEQYLSHECLAVSQSPDELYQKILIKGCEMSFGEQHLNYMITDLGEFPCIKINIDQRMTGSHHWLISMTNKQSDFMQIRIAMPEDSGECTTVRSRLIKPGILSWMNIPNYG